ncbi:hypothetical protein DVJ83_14605 (plasmid) [Deinococcus wulumuqiensis]|uniref:Uncharacterized protein n=1 Tax=Deinococcus wulumuqiensis TaxID=980427 RepID=A0A345IL24_9DEIO|nr:hypothetical protein DVJ83_14605 [Deinococcus wulumuqiensis]
MHPYRRIRIFSYSHPLCCAALQVGLNLKLPDSIGIRITGVFHDCPSDACHPPRLPDFARRDCAADPGAAGRVQGLPRRRYGDHRAASHHLRGAPR